MSISLPAERQRRDFVAQTRKTNFLLDVVKKSCRVVPHVSGRNCPEILKYFQDHLRKTQQCTVLLWSGLHSKWYPHTCGAAVLVRKTIVQIKNRDKNALIGNDVPRSSLRFALTALRDEHWKLNQVKLTLRCIEAFYLSASSGFHRRFSVNFPINHEKKTACCPGLLSLIRS